MKSLTIGLAVASLLLGLLFQPVHAGTGYSCNDQSCTQTGFFQRGVQRSLNVEYRVARERSCGQSCSFVAPVQQCAPSYVATSPGCCSPCPPPVVTYQNVGCSEPVPISNGCCNPCRCNPCHCSGGSSFGLAPSQPTSCTGQASALDQVNRKRQMRGLPPYSMDPTLTNLATRNCQIRADRNINGHNRGNPTGGAMEGVGNQYGTNVSPGDGHFRTCHMYLGGYHRAGAAEVCKQRGNRTYCYYHLLVK